MQIPFAVSFSQRMETRLALAMTVIDQYEQYEQWFVKEHLLSI